MHAYSMDLRKRVLSDCDVGLKTKAVATKYQVSASWVRRLKQRRRESGEMAPRPGGHRRRLFDRRQLARLVAQRPDATLAELRDRLGVQCSLVAIWSALRQVKITYKKNAAGQRARSSRCRRKTDPLESTTGRLRSGKARFR